MSSVKTAPAPPLKGFGRGLLVGAACMFTAYNGVYNVEEGHKAVVYNRLFGVVRNKVYPEGKHLLIPFFQKPIIYDVRLCPHNVKCTWGCTSDLQMVKIGLRVLTRPQQDQLQKIYRKHGENFYETVLPRIAQDALERVVPRYSATQLLTQREDVMRETKRDLIWRAAMFHIDLHDVAITNLTFEELLSNEAMSEAEKAEGESQRAKFAVEKEAKPIVSKEAERAKLEAEKAKFVAKTYAKLQIATREAERAFERALEAEKAKFEAERPKFSMEKEAKQIAIQEAEGAK